MLLSKVDRDHIRHEVEKLMRLSGVSEQQNKNIRSDLQQVQTYCATNKMSDEFLVQFESNLSDYGT